MGKINRHHRHGHCVGIFAWRIAECSSAEKPAKCALNSSAAPSWQVSGREAWRPAFPTEDRLYFFSFCFALVVRLAFCLPRQPHPQSFFSAIVVTSFLAS